MESLHITVVGAGVIGLTTACYLQSQGYSVDIVAAALPRGTTSAIAAAIWLPYLAEPKEKVNAWSRSSYHKYGQIAVIPGSGVSLVDATVLSTPDQAVDWLPAIPNGQWRIIKSGLPAGYSEAIRVRVPLIQSQIYLPWLLQQFELGGGKIVQKHLKDLRELKSRQNIVNCSGLGAKALCADEQVFPVRGQILKVKLDHPVSNMIDDEGPNSIAYILQREDGIILGGTAQPHDNNDAISESDSETILKRCSNIIPALKSSEIEEIKVGLRPARKTIRLEWDETLNVIHNYGHGGCGYTTAWGCAEEVFKMLAFKD